MMKYTTLFALFSFLLSGCGFDTTLREYKAIDKNIGETFILDSIQDATGALRTLDLQKADYTIVDLWFRECPPCIKDMAEFEELLKGKEGKVHVVSISVNQPWHWQEVMDNASGNVSFLKKNISNWEHRVLASSDNPRFRNKMSTFRIDDIMKRYGVGYFPAYFVLDRKGNIVKRPETAVAFLKDL